MLLGEFRRLLDPKSRLAVPAKFGLHGNIFLTRGIERCLTLYDENAWSTIRTELDSRSFMQSDARAMRRHVYSGASEVELDNQGRIVVPDYLREYAHLDKDVVIIGIGDHAEIWDAKEWEDYKQKTESQTEVIAEKLSLSGK